jgi:transposase InsO family protein
MQVHARARLTPKGRGFVVARVLEQGWSVTAAAEAAGVAERTVYRWLARYRAEGEAGLSDRSSAPRRIPHRTPIERVELVLALRRLRMTSSEISELLQMPLSTVSAVLRREGLGRLSRLEPPEPPNRYERKRPGELVHVDVKKLGRISERGAGHRMLGPQRRASQFKAGSGGARRRGVTGWEFVHVAVDDATRLAYVEVLADERGQTAAGFLRRAVAFFGEHGVSVERMMSDNGACYRSTVHAAACRELGIRHLFTRPYRPRTNGKAERFIQTMIREWAYGRLFGSNAERVATLPAWLERYNWRRPHGSLNHRPPGERLAQLTNVAGIYA